MRKELEQIKYIEDYLLGNLSEPDKQEFELKMNSDENLAREVEMQRILMKRLKVYALRKTISKTHRKFLRKQRFSLKNRRFNTYLILTVVVITITVTGYLVWQNTENPIETTLSTVEPFVNPPLDGVDVPFTTYQVDPQESRVIAHPSGSMIHIPSGAFLDVDGKVVTGEVEVIYREFHDPIDFFLAGIPMDMEVDGETYTMESAAMCEINATSEGKQLQVNPDRKISIFQASYTTSNAFDLFYLDQEGRKWERKWKDNPINKEDYRPEASPENYEEFPTTEIEERPARLDVDISSSSALLDLVQDQALDMSQPMIKPRKADLSRYSFFITVDYQENPELRGFENVSFEIHENETRYKEEHGDIEWENFQIEKQEEEGVYLVTFMKYSTDQWVQYLTRAVFDEEDYEKAMDKYIEHMAQFSKKRTDLLTTEAQEQQEVIQYNRILDSINREIEKRNVITLAHNQRIDSLNRLKKETAEKLKELRKRNRKNTDLHFKRNELALYKAIPAKQLKRLMEYKRHYLYQLEDEINKAYEDNKEYIGLKEKANNMEHSPLIPAETRELLAQMDRKTLMDSADNINHWWMNLVMMGSTKNTLRNKIFREFEVDGFGIWNCDILTRMMPYANKVSAEFKDVYGGVYMNEVVFADDERNSLIRINRAMYPAFAFNSTRKNYVWAVTNDKRMVYFKDFECVPDTTNYTFDLQTMEAVKGEFETFKDIKDKLRRLMEE